ncbi:MAG: hypothetical protein GY761_07025, partial [Hyphomicrobiales bacterium]|nr:hypothetical protein [Hyphomicrobiales bacterium]
AMWFALINAIKEQQEIIDSQQADINAMKVQNEALQTKADDVDALKAEIENIKTMLGMNNEIVKNK